ncbi:HXXXD-type acyl-transferase family protein [Actinidia rufa]|uniref:HXXXD-type acyl-transferase family protein n=1 Tax=Actinidia rufa TaxID=165716 RepID=A0A7J0ECD4_9ERIC|nr:HXXXD-type acyl-transferase family protein [Actinidia rufa]
MSSVKILSKVFVKPKKPIGRRECQLVTFDLPYIAFYYNQKLLFYKGGDSDFEERVEKLKEGLGVVLEEFYQLAGKLGKDEEGVFRVEYDDDMDGVEVEVAAAEEIGIADLLATFGRTAHEAERWAGNGPSLQPRDPRRFRHVALHEFLDRGLHRGPNHLIPALPGPHQSPQHARKARPLAPIRRAAHSHQRRRHRPGPTSPSARLQVLRISHRSDQIANQLDAIGRLKSPRRVSTSSSPIAGNEMPETYFGNLIQAIFTGTAAGLLAAHPPEFGAGIIQKAIEAHDAKAIDARNIEWEASPKIFQWKDAGVNCVAVGSSPRFKVYSVDFGWGPPEIVRSGSNNRFDGMVYLYQGKSGGRSIDVEISLEANAMERLQKDKDFLMEA